MRNTPHAQSSSTSVPPINEVNIDQPPSEQTEALYTRHQKSNVVRKSVHEYHELEQFRIFEGGNTESHTYEAVLSERDNENTNELSMFSDTGRTYLQNNGENIGDDERAKKISDANLSTSNVGSQYSVLDHTVVSNSVQKGSVKAVINRSSTKGRYYNEHQVHELSLVSNSSVDSDHLLASPAGDWGQMEGSPHLYQKLDHHNTLAPASQETTDKNPMESTGDHEYHVLEEANAPYNRSISGPFKASNTATSTKVNSSSEQLLSASKQGPAVVFDDPLYSSFPNDHMRSAGEHAQSEEPSESDINRSPKDDLLVSSLRDSVSNASHDQLLSECDQNPPMLFDDPLYSSFPNDHMKSAGKHTQSEEVNESDTNGSSKGDLHASNLCDTVFTASHDQLLSECDQNPPMLFDDPLYSVLPPDKRSTATPSQVVIDRIAVADLELLKGRIHRLKSARKARENFEPRPL